jgi:mRNA interferase MazF
MNRYLNTVVVCPMTSRLHPNWRSRITVPCNKQRSEIAVDQIRTLSKLRIQSKIDSLNDTDEALLRELITKMYGTA